jgi:pSer/pThr/pTyr-binding forkhead associated (FHA) protein
VGRGRAASVRLRDPQASRAHARVRLGADGASVEDLGAKNGLRVNGVRLERRAVVPLAPGDELGVGETLLAFEAPGAASAEGPAPAAPRTGGTRRRAAPTHLAAAALLALSAAALLVAAS